MIEWTEVGGLLLHFDFGGKQLAALYKQELQK